MSNDSAPLITDEQLVAEIKTGGTVAKPNQRELYQRHGNNLIGFLMNKGCQIHEAEDLAQEVWLKVFSKSDQFDGRKFSAWLYEIARNQFVDHRRRKQPTLLAEVPETIFNQPTDLAAERLEALKTCLEMLKGEMIDVLRARLAGEDVATIAVKYNIEEKTVYTRVSRAKADLSKCIGSKVQ